MTFSKLRIAAKLILGFSAVLFLSVLVGAIALVNLRSIRSSVDDLSSNLTSINALGNASMEMADLRTLEFANAIVGTEEARNGNDQEAQHHLAELRKHLDTYQSVLDSEEDRRLFPQLKAETEDYLAQRTKSVQFSHGQKFNEMLAQLMGPSASSFDKMNGTIEQLIALNDKSSAKAASDANAIVQSSWRLVLGILALSIVIGLAAALVLARKLSNPLRRAADTIRRAEEDGDLTVQLEVTSGDEVGQICSGFNSFIRRLHDAMLKVAGSADQVASASEELSSSATQMAESAKAQTDQTGQVATATQEMSATVLEVADNCNKAAASARQTAAMAQQGGEIVSATIASMKNIAESTESTATKIEELGKSSDQIGKIVSVIDDIADQTNLLALNAAIEAARAGDQGRGFAVVADEVRKLAERTTVATKEIADMIKAIQVETHHAVSGMQLSNKQVQAGLENTEKAGESLKEIIRAAEQVGEMIAQIATATEQQSSATEQVSGNVNQIAILVKQSGDGAQQSAQACQSLSSLSAELKRMLDQFRLQSEPDSVHSVSFVAPATPRLRIAS